MSPNPPSDNHPDAYPETLQQPLTPNLLTGVFGLDRLSIRIDLVDDRLVAWGIHESSELMTAEAGGIVNYLLIMTRYEISIGHLSEYGC